MLVGGSKLVGKPVLSLHLGGQIAKVTGVVVDPEDLKIIAMTVEGPQTGDGDHGDILDVRSIREYSNLGIIVDSIDEFVSRGDVVKIDKVMDLNFSLTGLNVKTKKGTKLGKVEDFNFEPKSMQVIQLVVKRPILKAFIDPLLIIGRSEIKEVNDYEIIVKDEEDKIRKNATKEDFVPNFVNPFRDKKFATNERKDN